MTDRRWSDGLRAQTLEALEMVPALPDGKLHMKHIAGGYGCMDLMDLVNYVYALRRDGSDEVLHFADAAAVVDAGWAID